MDVPIASPALSQQLAWLLILALPIACVSWTVTHEEIFREAREGWTERSRTATRVFWRKFFYTPTCEYCFSHYVTLAFQTATGYWLLIHDWRGYVIGFFALVGLANAYLSVFGWLRVAIAERRARIAAFERKAAHDAVAGRPERWREVPALATGTRRSSTIGRMPAKDEAFR